MHIWRWISNAILDFFFLIIVAFLAGKYWKAAKTMIDQAPASSPEGE